MNTNPLVIIDCGHGGIDSEGNYTTAPSKMFVFPDGTIAYEGVYNRLIGEKIACKLADYKIKMIYTVQPSNPLDMSLVDRVRIEHRMYRKGFDTIFLSLHSNAGKGTGFEIFTSRGQTQSDIVADEIGEMIHAEFPEIKFRRDMTDGDLDKESGFYVLTGTKGAAVLLESLFFDNREDFELLCTESFQNRLANAVVKGIVNYIERK